jgi:hypothetical protein
MDHEIILLEQQSLEALLHNYRHLEQLSGSITFVAEADSPVLTATAWHFTESENILLKQKGIKAAILELLDTLVEQRKQHRIRPNREGRLLIKNGMLEIEWLTEGTSFVSSSYEQTG